MIASRIRLRAGRLQEYWCFSRSSIKLTVGSALSVKKYGTTENGFAHQVLSNKERYKISSGRSLLKLENENSEVNLSAIKWKSLNGSELCRIFTAISLKASAEGNLITDSQFNDMCASISSRCPELNHYHLKTLLAALTLWPTCASPYEPTFKLVWKGIDSALVSKFKEYNVEKTFELVDLWYQLRLIRKSDFVYHALNRIAKRPARLRPEHVVLLLFYQNTLRNVSKNVKMFPLVEKFGEIAQELTIEEVGIACMGFFKTENPIKLPRVVDAIISKLLKNADTVPEIPLASIFKALRYQLPFSLWHRIPEIMDTFCPQIDRLSITGAVHIPLMLTGSQTIHENILDAVSEKLIKEIDSARIKDIEKVLFPLALLNYEPNTSKCVFQTVVDQLNRPEREEEFQKWPKCLTAILHYLTIKGIFLDHFVDRVLDMDFVRSTYGTSRYCYGREVLFIDSSIELEKPSYTGKRLPTETRNYLSKRYCSPIPDPERTMSKQFAFELEITQLLENLSKKQCVRKYLLPHHPRSDIVLRVGTNGDFLPLPGDFVSIENYTGPIRSPGADYLALIPISRNVYIRNRQGAITGETSVKLKQLEILGFKPLLVNSDSWPNEGSEAEKEEHLKKLISDCVSG